MQIYYDKFKKQFPNVTKEEYERIYNFLEHEGFISTTRRGHHEIYSFFEESKKNYPKDIANKIILCYKLLLTIITNIFSIVNPFIYFCSNGG